MISTWHRLNRNRLQQGLTSSRTRRACQFFSQFQGLERKPGLFCLGFFAVDGIGALDAGGERGFEKAIKTAIEHRAGIAGFDPGAQIFDHLIGLQHVRADLVPPADIGLGGVHGIGLGFPPRSC